MASSLVLADVPTPDLYSFLAPVTIPPRSSKATFRNWARTFQCHPFVVFEPRDEYQCQLIVELARREGRVVRAVGVGHSPSDLPCTNDIMLLTAKLNRVLEVNVEERYVTVQAGIMLQDLHAELAKHNLAMTNLGSISDQTLAGIVCTASHGTGINYGVMSTQVVALSLLLADGSRVTCSRSERQDLFLASICGLGSTGFILSIQLRVEPAFRLKATKVSMPFPQFLKNLDSLVHSAEHVSFWWFPTADMVRCTYSNRTSEPLDPAESWWWYTLIIHHAVQFLLFLGRFFGYFSTLAQNFVAWLSSKESVVVDISHRVFNVDCMYSQYTTEWSIPYRNAEACLSELHAWLRQERMNTDGVRPDFPIEVRFTAADDIWLSPSYGQQSCWIGVIKFKPYGLNVSYRKLFRGYESIVSWHQGRPHWAKDHALKSDELRKLYPRFGDYEHVIDTVDPSGLFRNEYVQRHIMGRSIDRRVFKARRT